MQISVNYVSLLSAAIASMVVGFLWYGPLFGKAWMKLKGFTKESLQAEQKKLGLYYGLSFLLTIIMAFVLSHIMALSNDFYGYPLIQTGLTTAFWVWLGFVMPVQATATIFGHKKWGLFGIDTGYQLASLLVMGLVLGGMGHSGAAAANNVNVGKSVTFSIQIDKKKFGSKEDVIIKILNEEQIEQSKKMGNCVVSFDVSTQKEATNCPPGVEYKEVTPETFTFKVSEVIDPLVIKSNSVKVGQKYSLNISGSSPDNCNTTAASVEKIADSVQQNIQDLQWASTFMRCSQ